MAKNRNNQFKQAEAPVAEAPVEAVEPAVDAVEQEQETATEEVVVGVTRAENGSLLVEVADAPVARGMTSSIAMIDELGFAKTPPIEDEPVIEAPAADAGVVAKAPSFAVTQAVNAPAAPTVESAEGKEVALLRVYLNNYATDIQNPANKNTNNGARCQLGFYRLVYGVLSSKTEFAAKFEALLEFMRKHADGICNSRSLFAYYPSIPTDPKQAANFLSATQFCSTLATAKTPKEGAKQVDIGKLLTSLSNPQITHNVTTWLR